MAMTHGAAWGALVLRVVLGIILVMHAYGSLFIVGPGDLAATVTRHGFPPGTAGLATWYAIGVQALGGALIVIGLWTRRAALVNIPVMLGALLLLHWPQGFFMRAIIADPSSGRAAAIGYELSLLVLACTVAVALIGAGPYSIDSRRNAPGRRR